MKKPLIFITGIILTIGTLITCYSSFAEEDFVPIVFADTKSIKIKESSILGRYVVIEEDATLDKTYIVPVKNIRRIYYRRVKTEYGFFVYHIFIILEGNVRENKMSFYGIDSTPLVIQIGDWAKLKSLKDVKRWLKETFDIDP